MSTAGSQGLTRFGSRRDIHDAPFTRIIGAHVLIKEL